MTIIKYYKIYNKFDKIQEDLMTGYQTSAE